jgi:predicted ferric reductase
MALALMPVLFMLAAKRNLISVLTGISHERLQVFHQWVAYFMFVLALLHTVSPPSPDLGAS